MDYRVTPPEAKSAAELFAKIKEMLKEDKEMQADRKKLFNVCRAPVPQ